MPTVQRKVPTIYGCVILNNVYIVKLQQEKELKIVMLRDILHYCMIWQKSHDYKILTSIVSSAQLPHPKNRLNCDSSNDMNVWLRNDTITNSNDFRAASITAEERTKENKRKREREREKGGKGKFVIWAESIAM